MSGLGPRRQVRRVATRVLVAGIATLSLTASGLVVTGDPSEAATTAAAEQALDELLRRLTPERSAPGDGTAPDPRAPDPAAPATTPPDTTSAPAAAPAPAEPPVAPAGTTTTTDPSAGAIADPATEVPVLRRTTSLRSATTLSAPAEITSAATPGTPAPCTITWDGGAGDGSWRSGANWSTDSLPTSTDVACVGAGFSVTLGDGSPVTIAGLDVAGALNLQGFTTSLTLNGTSRVASYRQQLAVVDGPGDLVIESGTWVAGTMRGTGTTFVAAGGSLRVGGGVSIGRNLQNDGTITWTGGLDGNGNGTVGPLNATRDTNSATTSPVITNNGTMTVSATPLQLNGNLPCTGCANQLTLVQATTAATTVADGGTLRYTGTDVTWGGTVDVRGLLAADFAAPTSLTGSLRVFGTGALQTSSTTTVTGSLTFDPGTGFSILGGQTTIQPAATVSFRSVFVGNGQLAAERDVTIPSLEIGGFGGLNGSATTTATSLTWRQGTVGGTGTLVVPTGGVATVSTSDSSVILDGRFRNEGTASLDGTINVNPGGTLTNAAGGTLALLKRTVGPITAIGSTGSFVNEGLLTVAPGISARINAVTSFGGTTQVAGVLELTSFSPNTLTGTIDVGSAGQLSLLGGGRLNVLAGGNLTGTSSSTLFVNGNLGLPATAGTFSIGRVAISNALATIDKDLSPVFLGVSGIGRIEGSGNLSTVELDWNGGTIGGTGTLTVPAGGSGRIYGDFGQNLTRSFVNEGSVSWTKNTFALQEGDRTGTFTNRGVFTVDTKANVTLSGGTFVNEADAFFAIAGGQRLATTGTLALGGTTLLDGSLQSQGSTTVSGTMSIAAGGELQQYNGSSNVTGSGTIEGSGTVRVSFGSGLGVAAGPAWSSDLRLVVEGTTFVTDRDLTFAVVQQTSGLIGGSGRLTTTDHRWSGGQLLGTGGFTIPVGGTAAWSGGTKTLGRSYRNEGTLTWTEGYTTLQTGAVLTNAGTMVADGVGRTFGLSRSDGSVPPPGFETDTELRVAAGTTFEIDTIPAGFLGTTDVFGTLRLRAGFGFAQSNVIGDLYVDEGGVLELSDRHTLRVEPNSFLSTVVEGPAADGLVRVDGGRLWVPEPTFPREPSQADITRLEVRRGTATFDRLVVIDHIAQSGGQIDGSGEVVTFDHDFSGGTLAGSGDFVLEVSDGRSPSTWGPGRQTIGRTYVNYAVIEWTGPGIELRTDLGTPRPTFFNYGTFEAMPLLPEVGTATISAGGPQPEGATFVNDVFGTAPPGELDVLGPTIVPVQIQLPFRNNGLVDVRRRTLRIDQPLNLNGQVWSAGAVSMSEGTLVVPGPIARIGASVGDGTTMTLKSTSRILTTSNADALAGLLQVDGNLQLSFGNTQTFSSPLTVLGRLEIGLDTTVTVPTYAQGPSGVLRVQLAGTVPGTSYGQLRVTGTASLAGTVEAELANGFNPYSGSFTVVDAASLSGTFSTVVGGDISTGLAFSAAYDTAAGDVQLVANSPFSGCTLVWRGTDTTDLAAPDGWSPARIPSADDVVCFPSSSGRATLATTALTVAGMRVFGRDFLVRVATGGELTVKGTVESAGSLLVTGGTLTLDGPTTTRFLGVDAGLLTGAGTITVPTPAVVQDGGLVWNGGTIGGTGSIVLEPDTLTYVTGEVTLGRRLEVRDGLWSGGLSLLSDATGTGHLVVAGRNDVVANGGNDFAVTRAGDGTTDPVLEVTGTGSLVFSGDQPMSLAAAGGVTIRNDGLVRLEVIDRFTPSADLLVGGDDASGGAGRYEVVNATETTATNGELRFVAGTHTLTGTGAVLTGDGLICACGGSVVVPVGASATVTSLSVRAGRLTVNGTASPRFLGVSGGLLDGAGTITVPTPPQIQEGGLAWSGGTIAGTGTLVLEPDTLIGISGDVTLGRRLELGGAALVYEANISLRSDATGVADLELSGSADLVPMDGPLTISRTGAGPTDPTFTITPSGRLVKSGVATASIGTAGGIRIRNDGVVLVADESGLDDGGTLELGGNAASGGSGTYAADDGQLTGQGSVLRFVGGTHTLTGAARLGAFDRNGQVEVVGGTVRLVDSATVDQGDLVVGGTGTLDVDTVVGPSDPIAAAVSRLTLAGSGTFDGDAEVLVTDLDWTGGRLAGAGIARIGQGQVTGTSAKQLAKPVEIVDQVVWGEGDVDVSSPGSITLVGNEFSNGVLAATGSGTLRRVGAAGPTLTVTPLGRLDKLDGGPTTISGVIVSVQPSATDPAHGLVRVVKGELRIDGPVAQLQAGDLGGAWQVEPAGRLAIAGADVRTLSGSLSVNGAGARVTDTGATPLDALRNLSLVTGTLRLDQAAGLTVSGDLENRGRLVLGPTTTVSVGGAFRQTAAGLLRVVVTGPLAGVDHSELLAGGAVTIGGALQADSPLPQPADTYRIVDGASLSGAFATITSPTFTDGTVFTADYDPAAGTVDLRAGQPSPTGGLESPSIAVGESAPRIPVDVVLARPADRDVTFTYATQAGTATAGVDYDDVSGTVTIPAGSTTATIEVPLRDDAVDEDDETVVLSITGTSGPVVLDVAQATLTIVDDDDLPTLTVTGVGPVTEGDTGTTFEFPVFLDLTGPDGRSPVPSSRTISVDLSIEGITATVGTDVLATPVTLTFPPGTTLRTFKVTVVGDLLVEGDETYRVRVTNPQNVNVPVASFVGTIVDDEVAPQVNVIPNRVAEGSGVGRLQVFGAGGKGTIVVPVTYADGFPGSTGPAATLSADYLPGPATITVTAGEFTTLDIPIVDDDLDEDIETLSISPGNGDTSFLEIADDDPPPIFRVADARLVEGDAGARSMVFTIRLTNAVNTTITSGRAASVFASTRDGTATAGADYQAIDNQIVEFPAGTSQQTVSVPILGDTLLEGDETFRLLLEAPVKGELLPAPLDGATGTIVDDDADAGDVGRQLDQGTEQLRQVLPQWSRFFDVDRFTPVLGTNPFELPVATDQLATRFDTEQQALRFDNPMQGLTGSLDQVLQQIEDRGCTIDSVRNGIGGRPVAEPGDLLQVRCVRQLEDLAPGLGDQLNDSTSDVLGGLASSLGLDADLGLQADFVATLVFGIDLDGFYVSPDTGLRLDLTSSPTATSVTGGGTVGGGTATVTGSGATALQVGVGATGATGRLRAGDLGGTSFLRPRADGTASLDLSVTTGPLSLRWQGSWSATDTTVTTGTQTVTGTLSLPGLTKDDGTGATLQVVGVRNPSGTWTISGSGEAGQSYRLGGFGASALSFTVVVGPGTFDGSGTATLVAPLPGQPTDVTVTFAFSRTSLTVTGAASVGSYTADGLVSFTGAQAQATFTALLPSGPLVGSITLTAGTVSLVPVTATLTGVTTTLTSAGALAIRVSSASVTIADAIDVSLTDVSIGVGPGTGPDLLSIPTAVGTFRNAEGLTVTFTGFALSKSGTFRASSAQVDSVGFARTIGLGGILPFDVLTLTATFPQPTDLSVFDLEVIGRFDLSAFPTIQGFTPRVGLGGPVVTVDTPEDQNRFRFSVRIDVGGGITPIDAGPLTLGFDGLPAGDYRLGAELTLGGYQDGEFVPTIGGGLTIDGPSGTVLDRLDVTLSGTFTTSGGTTTLAVDGSATLTGALGGGVEVTDLELQAGFVATFGSSLGFEPVLRSLSVGELRIPLGDLVTLSAAGVSIDLAPAPGDDLATLTGDTGLSVRFEESFPVLAGWGGAFGNVALGPGFVPRLLPGFFVRVDPAPGQRFGLPDWLPLELTSFQLTFPDLVGGIPPGGIEVTDLLDGLRLQVSGGIRATDTWPISATVDGLEVDLGKLVQGEFPITNLDGFRMGVEPFELPGGVTVGGGLELGTFDVDGTTVFYGRVFGDLSVADIGFGADLVVTQFGPVLLKVRAPVGIPLGPTGLVFADVVGAAQFGGDPIPQPPTGDPVALLNAFTLPTELTLDVPTIKAAVTPAVRAGVLTWDRGFSLALAGNVVSAVTPGVLKATVTVGANLGFGAGGGLQLVGKGTASGYGVDFGAVGILVDLRDPLAPGVDLAFASPVPGSALALLLPATTTFGIQVRTDGLILGTVRGLRVFADEVVAGTLGASGPFFDETLRVLAAELQADHGRPLSALLLDLDGSGTVSPTEDARTITRAFLVDRLVGRNGVPALLPSAGTVPTDAQLPALGRVVNALLAELLRVAGDVADGGAFSLPVSPQGFESLQGAGGRALGQLAAVLRDATRDGLAAFGQRLNPSLAITGALQPSVLGIPMGDPDVGGTLFLDRTGIFFEIQGSVTGTAKKILASSLGPASGPAEAALTAATAGIQDQLSLGVRLPIGGLVDQLLGGGSLPTVQPLDPGWAVTVSGGVSVFGYEFAEVGGIAFPPNASTFLGTRVQKLYEQPAGTPVDPNRIPITSKATFDRLVQYGGLLVTGALRAPNLAVDPLAVLASVPPPPPANDPIAYAAWLNQVAAAVSSVATPARVQLFVPGIPSTFGSTEATAWAQAFSLEGVWNGKALSLDLGQATLKADVNGVNVTGGLPLAGLTGTATLNTNLLDQPNLPTGGLEVALSTAKLGQALQQLGVPPSFSLPVDATGSLRAYTPGFDRTSTDSLKRFGGVEVEAALRLDGLSQGALGFRLALSPRAGGFDVRARATATQLGPIAGVTIDDASLDVRIVNGTTTVRVQGTADVLGATATVDGTLNGDLTGSLTLTFAGGSMDVGGARVQGTAVLTLTRASGSLVGNLGLAGTATLPSWLATATGQATLAAAGCVDTAGNAELRLALPALRFGPTGQVQVGANTPATTLTGSPACTVPPLGVSAPADGPSFALRRSSAGAVSASLDGNLRFLAPGASVAGLRVRGLLDGRGTGTLSVSFNAGSISLSGFSVSGSANATFGLDASNRPTFAMAVTGRVSVPGLVSNVAVTGTADETGITLLDVDATGATVGPVNVDSATLRLVRTSGTSTYRLSASLQVDVANVANDLRVAGTFDSTGSATLNVSVTSLSILGAQITNGTFSFVRTPTSLSLSASGRFGFLGAQLDVLQASLTINADGPSGSLTIQPPGGGVATLAGWGVGGTLRLVFNRTAAAVSLTGGTLTIPGSGTVGISGTLSTAGTGTLAITLPSGGLRLGGGSSPFFAVGAFTLRFANGVGTFSAANAGVEWRSGTTVVAAVTVNLFSVSTDGSVNLDLPGWGVAIGDFRLTAPSVKLLLDAGGLNARLAVGAGSVAIPGLPSLVTPPILIDTTATFEKVLAASSIDLGVVTLVGTLVLRGSGGTFTLSIEGPSTGGPALFRIEGLVDVRIADLTIASDGSFSLSASVPRFGSDDLGVVGAGLTARRTGGATGTFTAAITGGRLLVGTADPVSLPDLRFSTGSRFDETFTTPRVELGPFLKITSAQIRLRQLSTGVLRLEVLNTPSVSMFDGSGALVLNSLLAESDGTFVGSITGRLALFGRQISSATFDVQRVNGVVELALPAGDGETLNLGFLTMGISGVARSDGTFSFSGSASTGFGVTGFGISGSTSITVANTGISGSFSGQVCLVACASGSATLRSDGRLSGRFTVSGVVDASWRLYLATGALWIDINRDGDYEDLGDIVIGTIPEPDLTPPSMTTPSDIFVTANIFPNGLVSVYYNPPVAYAAGVQVPVQCTPASGADFPVGTTTVSCSARDAAGNVTRRTFDVVVTASSTATTPTATGGAVVLVTATGFLPLSVVSIRLFSEPTYLATVQADAQGRVTYSLTVPVDLPPGDHDLVFEGIGADGQPFMFVQPIRVRSASGCDPVTGSGCRLPGTGVAVAGTTQLSLALLALGTVLVALARRRRDGELA